MSTRLSRAALTGAIAVVLLFVAHASAATAAWLQFSPGGNITATSLGAITFETDALIDVACNIEMTGRLETVEIEKLFGSEFGTISNVVVTNCTSGARVRILNLPWTLHYDEITGELPLATGLAFYLLTAQFEVTVSGVSCLYVGSPDLLLPFAGTAPFGHGLISSLENNVARSLSSPRACAANVRLRGEFGLSPAQQISRIS